MLKYIGRYGNEKRTKEQKIEIIGKHLNEHISVRVLEKEYNADRSMICHWLRDYGKYGEAAFNPKGHPGNPFAALHTSKTLTETERLRLQQFFFTRTELLISFVSIHCTITLLLVAFFTNNYFVKTIGKEMMHFGSWMINSIC